MRIEIKIPAMGESIVEATIGQILRPSGSVVKPDEEIIEIETDKVNQVLGAPAAGVVQFSVKTGDTVKVGQQIGFIETSAQKAQEPSISATKPPSGAQSQPKESDQPSQPQIAVSPQFSARIPIDEALDKIGNPKEKMPIASSLSPQEVRQSSAKVGGDERESRKKMSKLRRVIAERLVEVKNQTALLTTFNEVDLTACIAIREKEQENFQKKHGVKLGFMSFFVKACAAALQEFPDINSRIEGDEIVTPHFYDIGVAVSTDKGLMVPVIRNADILSYADIEKQLKVFAEKARNGTIGISDMQGGTFTITNGGVFGSLLSTPILNPPQSGILGMHSIVKRPIAVGDEIVIRPMMYVALSYDHRIVDGKDSIQFLVHIKKNLEDPARLLLDL